MKSITTVDLDKIKQAISQSGNLTEAVAKLGFNSQSSSVRAKLNEIIATNNIDVSHFPSNRASDRWTEDNVIEAVRSSNSYMQALILMGVSPRSGNFDTLKRYIQLFGIDTSHFSQQESCKNTKQRNGSDVTLSLDAILLGEHPTYATNNLRRRLLASGIFDHRCAECGLTHWRDHPIALELDHINGINNDHRRENLRMLCPNCHALTPTYKGRNKKLLHK